MINIKNDIFKTQKKALLKKHFSGFQDERQRENFYTLKILDHIQQDHKNARNLEKSIAAICKGEGVSFEQVFYIFFWCCIC